MSTFRELGLEPIINASGTVTRLGGAAMPPAVLDAFVAAAAETVPLEQLQAAASVRIAAATGAEAGLVTARSRRVADARGGRHPGRLGRRADGTAAVLRRFSK